MLAVLAIRSGEHLAVGQIDFELYLPRADANSSKALVVVVTRAASVP
jgi:hypothetical protein